MANSIGPLEAAPSSSSAELLRKLNNRKFPRPGFDPKVTHTQQKDVSELVAWCGKTRKTKKAVATIEQLISTPEVLIINEDLIEVLKFIARLPPTEDGRRLFSKLMASKSFSCDSLRLQFERMLEVKDVLRLFDYAMAELVGCVGAAEEQFDKTLELCACLIDSSSHKLVWRKECAVEIEGQLAVLNTMVSACSEFLKIQASAKARRVLPKLFAPPRTDYSVRCVKVKRVELL